jgi:hypothetical protein
MRSKIVTLAVVAVFFVALSGNTFAKGSSSSAKHVAVGTITSIDANQVVITEKVKGKDQPMTFKLDSSSQKSGNLANGSAVTIQYRTENNQNIVTTIRQRAPNAAKENTKGKTSAKKS